MPVSHSHIETEKYRETERPTDRQTDRATETDIGTDRKSVTRGQADRET